MRDDQGAETTGLRKKAVTLASIIALIALLVGSLFGDRGFLQLAEQKRRAETLAGEIEALRTENGRLAEEIRALLTDPATIERLAREELGLARPGETVFLVQEEASADHP